MSLVHPTRSSLDCKTSSSSAAQVNDRAASIVDLARYWCIRQENFPQIFAAANKCLNPLARRSIVECHVVPVLLGGEGFSAKYSTARLNPSISKACFRIALCTEYKLLL